MAGVFISYRRSDSAYALLLHKALVAKFGSERVFRDFESIEPGQDFVAAIDAALGQCAACVVIIGKGWLDSMDRLAAAEDFVRREIEAALPRTLVLPCLVGGSRMPAGAAVPQSLAPLLRRDAITIGDEYFDRDTEPLLAALERALAQAPAAAAPRDSGDYRALRAVELLKRLLSRLQVRAVELVQANEIGRALDELYEGLDVIMQLQEWSPSDLPLDLQLGYLYKTLGQAFDAAGARPDADRYLGLALALFNRVGESAAVQAAEKAGALNGLGNVLYERGDADGAIRVYRLALELAPDYAYAWHDLLAALLVKARAGQADVPAMENALARLQATGTGLPGLGAAHMAQLQAAVVHWQNRQAAAPQPAAKAKRAAKRAGRRSPRA
jgi:tetratricopeptide (TPR) repeat protein